MVSSVLFDHSASISVGGKPIAKRIVDELLRIKPGGRTGYSAGLDTALSVLCRSQI